MVGEDPRTTGHRAPVAAGLADHRSALSRDDRLVDGGDTIGDLAIARNDFTRRDDHGVAGAQLRRRHLFDPPAFDDAVRDRVRLGLAQRFRLRLAARLGHRFGKRGKQHREPEPEVDLQLETDPALARDDVSDEKQQHQRGAHFDDEDHGVLHQRHGIQLQKRILQRSAENLRIEQRSRADQLLRDERCLVHRRARDGRRRCRNGGC